MVLFKKLLAGNISFPITFWGYYILGSAVVALTYFYLRETNAEVLSPMPFQLKVWMGVGYIWKITAIVAVWNSSGKYLGRRVWFYLARIILAVEVILTCKKIITAMFFGYLLHRTLNG